MKSLDWKSRNETLNEVAFTLNQRSVKLNCQSVHLVASRTVIYHAFFSFHGWKFEQENWLQKNHIFSNKQSITLAALVQLKFPDVSLPSTRRYRQDCFPECCSLIDSVKVKFMGEPPRFRLDSRSIRRPYSNRQSDIRSFTHGGWEGNDDDGMKKTNWICDVTIRGHYFFYGRHFSAKRHGKSNFLNVCSSTDKAKPRVTQNKTGLCVPDVLLRSYL